MSQCSDRISVDIIDAFSLNAVEITAGIRRPFLEPDIMRLYFSGKERDNLVTNR